MKRALLALIAAVFASNSVAADNFDSRPDDYVGIVGQPKSFNIGVCFSAAVYFDEDLGDDWILSNPKDLDMNVFLMGTGYAKGIVDTKNDFEGLGTKPAAQDLYAALNCNTLLTEIR